jgi:hypothetical protein
MPAVMNPRAVGPMSMGFPSLPVAGPTVAGCRFRLQFAVPRCSNACARRRLHVAEYLDGWVPLRIMAQQVEGKRHWLWIETRRTVAAAAAKDYVRGCPGYVAKSFRMLG